MSFWSPYNYGFNAPVYFIDPTGMAPEEGGDPPNKTYDGGTLPVINVTASRTEGAFNDQSSERYGFNGTFTQWQETYGFEGMSYENASNYWNQAHGGDFDNYVAAQDKAEAGRIAVEKMKMFTFGMATAGSMGMGALTPSLVAPRGFNFSSPVSSPKSTGETIFGYHGVDGIGVRYVGISNNPGVRFGAHQNSFGTGKEFLQYSVKARFNSRIDARIWEQGQINKFGLGKNGGSLLNKRNEIGLQYWNLYGIK